MFSFRSVHCRSEFTADRGGVRISSDQPECDGKICVSVQSTAVCEVKQMRRGDTLVAGLCFPVWMVRRRGMGRGGNEGERKRVYV